MAKIEEPQSKRWKPEHNKKYWLIEGESIHKSLWFNDADDNWRYLIGNCFKTEEEAKEYKKQIEYTARYKNYIEEHSEPLDWGDDEKRKYYAEIETTSNRVGVDCLFSWRRQGTIYASSEKIIWDAINEIGEDNFKKYVLGVK